MTNDIVRRLERVERAKGWCGATWAIFALLALVATNTACTVAVSREDEADSFKVVQRARKAGVYSLEITPVDTHCVALHDEDENGIGDALSAWKSHEHGLTAIDRPDITCSDEWIWETTNRVTCKKGERVVLEVQCIEAGGLYINCEMETYTGSAIYNGSDEDLREHLPALCFKDRVIVTVY